jgi:hypothetical protein
MERVPTWDVGLSWRVHVCVCVRASQEEDKLMHSRDILALEKVKLEAQITMLTKAGGTAPVSPTYTHYQIKCMCVCLYIYICLCVCLCDQRIKHKGRALCACI